MSGGDIVSVNPTTGNRTLVSGAGMGTGENLNSAGFAIIGSNVYAANEAENDIAKIDTLTGNRTVVSSSTVGTGPGLNGTNIPGDVELDHSGNLLALTVQSSSLLRIDPTTGNRTLISGLGVGTGPDFGLIGSQIGLAADGTMFANQFQGIFTDQTPVLSIDPVTGNRTILSDATHGTGPLFAPSTALLVVPNVPEPSTIVLAAIGVLALLAHRWRRGIKGLGPAMALVAATCSAHAAGLPAGDIVISASISGSSPGDAGLLLVDPTTGDRTILSDNTHGTGPAFYRPQGVSLAPDGSLLVADQGPPNTSGRLQAIFRVDPATGDRTVVSDDSGQFSGRGLARLRSKAGRKPNLCHERHHKRICAEHRSHNRQPNASFRR